MRTEEMVARSTQDRSPFPRRSIEIDGRPIPYVDDGEGPVLLFVHAGTGSLLWRDVIVRLRGRFRCVALDVPDAGPSGSSRILEAFVHTLGLRDVTLVVHDLGGPVALGAARRLDDRIRALVVTESFGWPLPVDSPFLGMAVFGDEGVRGLPHPGMTDGYLRGVDGTLRTLLSDRPVLLVFGEEGPAVKAGFPAGWRERFPDAGLLLVEGAHHFPMADAPDLVARAIRGWWREEVLAA